MASPFRQFEHLKIRLEAIKSATNDFADDNCIGKGGFGKVYKGEMVHSMGQTMVVYKRLDRRFGQGDPEFWKEIMMLSFYKHKNIVSLLGYCDDCDEKILVYEYASKRSLDLHLHSHQLTWIRRLKICIAAARGISYLHSPDEAQLRVVHRDIKSSNILLDENWNAKIADFGLSKFLPANQKFTYLISYAVGTLGYCDPLYAEEGVLTKESDIYSFGVVLFEVLSGRLCTDSNNIQRRPLVGSKGLARECYEQDTLNDIIFSNIKEEITPYSLKAFAAIAYQCLKRDREERPKVNEIVTALETALRYQVADPAKTLSTHPVGILNVKVVRAMKLKFSLNYFSRFARLCPYTELRLTGDKLNQLEKTTWKYKNSYPRWNEEFNLDVNDPDDQALTILVYDWALVRDHLLLGMTVVRLKDLTPSDQPKSLTRDLMDPNDSRHNNSQGQIMVELVYRPFAEDQTPYDVIEDGRAMQDVFKGEGVLYITIHRGENLEGEHHTNPCVHMLLQGGKRETETMNNMKDPKWGSTFRYMLQTPPTNERLYLEVVSTSWTNLSHPKECVGYVSIDLADVVNNKWTNGKYDLIGSKSGGRLHVELEWKIYSHSTTLTNQL